MVGGFADQDGQTWYRIDGYDRQPPFFMTLADDSDLWAFVFTSGSLTAGRRDPEGAFLPYEPVVLAPVQIRTYSLARWRLCRQHRVAAMDSGGADVGRAPRGALWDPMTMMKLLLGAAAA